jgi:predicted SprT family Zn-dependent metalloprotease
LDIEALMAEWPVERLKSLLDEQLVIWRAEDLRAVIQITWNSRLRTTIGRALLNDMVLELNPLLLGRYPEQVRSVFIHEAAHLVARRLYGPKIAPHGRQWKALMLASKESTKATHDLDTAGLSNRPGRGRRTWVW